MKKPVSIIPLVIALSAIIIASSCRNEQIITFRSLLREMAAVEAVTRFPDPSYRLVQYSSYDRRSIHPDSSGWFANNDYTHFIREEMNDGRREYVMMETDGPGAIVRWWMTFGNVNALNSYVRVYIDNQSSPVIEGMAPQLVGRGLLAPEPLSAAVSPLTEPQRQGYNLYLPIPFSRSCKVTLENDSIVITPERRSPSIYYNMCARLYEEGTRVVSLKSEMLSADSLAVSECASAIAEAGEAELKEALKSFTAGKYSPGTACTVRVNESGLALSSFSLTLAASDTAAVLKNTMIRMRFDGKETVAVPAGCFFGTGYSYNSYRTRFSAVDADGKMSAFWLMPFRDSCEISVFNGSADSVIITASVTMVPYRWDSSSMHFGASWHEYTAVETAGSENTGGTGLHTDLNIAMLKGRGLYTGDAVVVLNTADAWWGEGDEKIYVDGEKFPSSFGTGTEDYFGYAWCRPEPFAHPLIAQPAGSGNFHPGMSINMRYRILDAIPFKESIRADIELWHWVKTVIDYGVTSYYYISPV
ncbi:MAG: glycoside hydrolase family 172 protein [Bacteroidales bacterium]|nr:glycoside hydrolase family 172 protein [Bacteroidales bacterium]